MSRGKRRLACDSETYLELPEEDVDEVKTQNDAIGDLQ